MFVKKNGDDSSPTAGPIKRGNSRSTEEGTKVNEGRGAPFLLNGKEEIEIL